MSFDDRMIQSLHKRSGASQDEAFAKKIQAEWNKFRPNFSDFKEVYSNEELAADITKLKSVSEKHDVKGEAGIATEYMAMELLFKAGLPTEDSEIIPCSHFDDVFNHIDFVVTPAEGVYIGVDATSDRGERLTSKITRLRSDLVHGNLGKLKYFTDPTTGTRGTIELPRVVLELRSEEVEKAKEYMLGGDKNLAQRLIDTYGARLAKAIRESLVQAREEVWRLHTNDPKLQKRYAQIVMAYDRAINEYPEIQSGT